MKQIMSVPMRRIRRIHFVGIGGAGMGGIAEVLHNLGYVISGSDIHQNVMTQRLTSLGIKIYTDHHAAHIQDVNVVVCSTAIDETNPEIIAAHQLQIPVIPRAQMLGELMRFRFGIAIAGTHGKTTTTSLITSILQEGELDPTFVIGGLLNSAGANARLGGSEYIVAEADESDASFLYLQPIIAIVTNIDADHMSTYDGDFNKLKETFITFLHHLPFYGLAILCIDDPIVREIVPQVSCPILTYGFAEDAMIRATQVTQQGMLNYFTVTRPNLPDLLIQLNLPGQHNVLNALAAIAVATELHITDATIMRALLQFAGVGRRMQVYGDFAHRTGTIKLIDDYGHHPREISATLQALRAAYPERRVVMVYQPHRYTRTRDLFDDFVAILSTVDALLLLDVYAAGEAIIPGADGLTLAQAIRQRGQVDPIFIADNKQLFETLSGILQADDVVLMQGAGNIGALAAEVAQGLKG